MDIRRLDLYSAAVLTMGLPGESRTIRALTGKKVDADTILLAGILDHLRLQAWSRSKNAKRKLNRPASIVEAIMKGPEEKEKDKVMTFDSIEEFRAYRARLLRGD